MRRSGRTALRTDAVSALADLASHKASGKSRAADYELQPEADIYETVDEHTYAEIAARKRKEARDFIAGNDYHQEADAMEAEFDMEDEMSMVRAERDRKRKRTSAPRVRREKPAKKVDSTFFQSFHATPAVAAEEPEEGGSGVLDVSLLDKDFNHHMRTSCAAKKKRKAMQRSVGDMLFDAPALPRKSPVNPEPLMPLLPEHAEDQYDAPPPSLLHKPSSAHVKKLSVLSKPSINDAFLEDSLDADALVAAADAAVRKSESKSIPTPAPPIPSHSKPNLPQVSHMHTVPPNACLAREANGDVVMFWTDAHEVRVNGGQHLYLFGKVPVNSINSGVYASVCVQVQGMERALYVLPRKTKLDSSGCPTKEPVKIIPDLYSEVTGLLMGKSAQKSDRLGAAAIRSGSNLPGAVKAKKVLRSCPFGDNYAPREPTEYLKVKFPYSNICRLYPDSSSANFSRVFGTRTSASEAICLKRKLKGPSWIRLTNASPLQAKVSHAKYALSIPSPNDINVAVDLSNKDPPNVTALCVRMKTVLNDKTGANELVMLAGVFIREVPLSGSLRDGSLEPGGANGTKDFVLVRPPDGKSVPFGFADRARSVLAQGGGVEVMPNEPALLNNFLTRLLRIDPDVIIGHDIMGFGLDVLIARMHARRSREWSRLGRLVQRRDLNQVVKNNSSSSWFKSEAIAGRLVLDTYSHAKELLMREKDYSLSALSKNVIASSGEGHAVVLPPSTDVSMVPKAFELTDSLCRLVSECSLEARTAGRLAAHLSILPLTRQLTCISGNLWSHTLRGARAERIEYLLCHEFKLIGSTKAGGAAKAGDIGVKLLLPDKLNKGERVKIREMFEAQQAAAVAPPAAPEAPTKEFGYGGAENVSADQANENGGQTPKSGARGGKSKSARRKPQYSGGLVLEPKKGFYDRYVLQLDFNSLYPSIIQEFNICFTTLSLGNGGEKIVDPDGKKPGTTTTDDISDIGVATGGMGPMTPPDGSVLEGVLPRVLRRLVQQRRQVKKLLKDERQQAGKETLKAQQLDIRQLAIKLTANSLYGCLGFEGSRFFARPLAEMVTCQGRDTLQKTVDLARDTFNAQVIYGDTDSLFVYTGLEDISRVRKVGTELKREVNKKYRTLEIEIDAIYKKMLLLKKKKYAALKVVDPSNPDRTVREVKGLDLVRHDWCDLSHDASEHFLTQIFKGQTSNIDDAVGYILSFLGELASKVKTNQISLSKYVITRALTKKPQDYPDGSSLPHVAVAMRLISNEKKRIKPGDYIKYVICTSGDGAKSGIAARAYHPDEVMASEGKLEIDTKYYLENQVLPPIMRLCDPIENIEASRVAVSLGLDGRRYEKRVEDDLDGTGNYLALGPASAAEKFRDVEPLLIECLHCKITTEFCGVTFMASGKAIKSSGLDCVKCHKRFTSTHLKNVLTLTTRTWIGKYYNTALILNGDDGSRKRETRNIGLGGNGALARRQLDEAWLYKQLRYLHFLMDVEERWRNVAGHEEANMPVSRVDVSLYEELLGRVDQCFDRNAYRFIDVAQFLVPLGLC